jgi:hypothetical protein
MVYIHPPPSPSVMVLVLTFKEPMMVPVTFVTTNVKNVTPLQDVPYVLKTLTEVEYPNVTVVMDIMIMVSLYV